LRTATLVDATPEAGSFTASTIFLPRARLRMAVGGVPSTSTERCTIPSLPAASSATSRSVCEPSAMPLPAKRTLRTEAGHGTGRV
jgi:hypothetical protein